MSIVRKLEYPSFRRGNGRSTAHAFDLYMQNLEMREMAKAKTTCDKCQGKYNNLQPVLVNQIHDSYVYEFHCEYCVDETKEKV